MEDGLEQDLQSLWRCAYEHEELDHSASAQCSSHLVQIGNCEDILFLLPRILEDVFHMKVKKEEERNSQNPAKAIEIQRDPTKV